eukprot:CAMPEP_0182441490 /NCGR_PEP_ID=MMETSP1172-20130603/455_1 /TAXON_ID=708627 /ORGANISM="Timspurckia oligopyrenoides, Strain CCMP3278" /LENGTH=247 /DNA_ID=CAMNT_0024635817 /DNA_START=435 /DNA_END=1178 /DNA_ORIENTATION=+
MTIRNLSSLCFLRREREEIDYKRTLQVVLIGAPGCAKEMLARKLCETFRMENAPFEGEIMEEYFTAGAHALESSPFAPNARVRGVAVRFSVLHTVSSIEEQRPDLVILCSKLDDIKNVRSMIALDKYLVKKVHHVPRIWTFVALPSSESCPSESLKLFRSVITNLPLSERPANYHVVYPAKSFLRDYRGFVDSVFFESMRACRRPEIVGDRDFASGAARGGRGFQASCLHFKTFRALASKNALWGVE